MTDMGGYINSDGMLALKDIKSFLSSESANARKEETELAALREKKVSYSLSLSPIT